MKKLFLLPIAYCMLIIGCQTTDSDVFDNEKKETLTIKQRSEDIPLIRKVSATFNKMVQKKEVWKKLQAIFEDNIAMKQSTKNNVYEDNIIFISDNIVEDNIMMKASWVFEDDIIMRPKTIKDDVLPKISLREIFTNTYNTLYPEENISYTSILQQLPKLYFGYPISALKNHDTWKKNGFPVLAKSYDVGNNKLQIINKEEAIKLVGIDNFNELIKNSKQEYENYYVSKSDVISIIAARENQGHIMTLKEGNSTIASFEINTKKHYNQFKINESKETYSISQSNMMYQTYIDLPNGCNGYYSFICGSLEMNTYTEKMQALANETCNTFWRCIPCCDPYSGGISYYTMIFEPTAIKCKKAQSYIQALSMYSLEINK